MKTKDFQIEFKEKYPKEVLEVEMDLKFQISRIVQNARISARLTQEKLARKIGTTQPSIARLESGSMLPSFRFLQKVLSACKGYMKVEFISSQNEI